MRTTNTQSQSIRKGATLALIVICLPIILIFAAYSVNVAYMQMVRAELRTATDAASRAGSRKLSMSHDYNAAEVTAIEAARRNTVAGEPLRLASGDLTWGLAQPPTADARWDFVAVSSPSDKRNSLSVTGSRASSSLSGSIPLLFPQFSTTGVFEPVKTSIATQVDRDLCLVLDRSGSMDDRVASSGQSKWSDLKKSVKAFLRALERTPQDEQVALVTYSTSATLDHELTLDYKQILKAMDKRFSGGFTAVGDGAARGRDAVTNALLARKYAQKTIVVLTDGRHNTGQYPDDVAKKAYEDFDITTHTIAFGDDANEDLMRKTARDGNGQFWKASTPESLTGAFEDIANNLPTLLTN